MKRILSLMISFALLFGLAGCGAAAPQPQTPQVLEEKQLHLSVGDSYDLGTMGYTLDELDGTAVYAVGDVITAANPGSDSLIVSDLTFTQYRIHVTVYATAAELGDRFPLDKGMFQGKKVIAFGDSITDGCLLDPNKPNGLNYEDTYFARLCRYLGAASDPTDLENCNFACGGTTISFGTNGGYGVSGVERVSATKSFTDAGRVRNPYPNILDADLCVIYYGTNDLTANIPAEAGGTDGITDTPQRPEDARTVRGGLYYMITTLRSLNPNIKILVLPPIFRRADGANLQYSADQTDVIKVSTGASLKQYGQVLQAVAQEQGAKFVDWYPVFDYESFGRNDATDYSYDGLHPNVAGHEKMFDYLVQALQAAPEN